MSKKTRRPEYKVSEGSVISTIKQHTKKGKIRGKNKKQTKILIGACPHHTTNSKGKIKPIISNDGKQWCTCRLCKASFKGRPYKNEELDNKLKGAIEVINQGKYLSVAVGAGNDTIRYFTELGSMLALAKKYYKRVSSLAEKVESIHNKKKKKKNGSDFGTMGAWR